jgi:CheY-like chemotaxis protein
MVAAWAGGLVPGLLACGLSALASASLLGASVDSLVELLLAGGLMSVLGEMLRRSTGRERRYKEELAHLQARREEEQRSAARSPRSVGRRILVVEDNENAAESLALLLHLQGHEARIARDGSSALAEAESWQPEVVLLDIGLPGNLDGYEIARLLRASRGPSLRLVALTGSSEEDDRRKAQEAGFDDFLVKPVGMEDINRSLEGP